MQTQYNRIEDMLCCSHRLRPSVIRSHVTKSRRVELASPRCEQRQAVLLRQICSSITIRRRHGNTSCRASGFCFDVACQREKDVLFALSIALPLLLAAASFLFLGRQKGDEVGPLFLFPLNLFCTPALSRRSPPQMCSLKNKMIVR